jgi:RNA polymerase sigma factor (sigma-70 family)
MSRISSIVFSELNPYAFAGIVATVIDSVVTRFCWYLGLIYCSMIRDRAGKKISDEQLMLRYQEGCSDSFRELFERYAPRLIRAARRKGLSDSESQDTVQQTFIHIHQSRNEFNRDARVAPWIFTIGFNVMRDYGRRISAHQRMKGRLSMAPQKVSQPADETVDRDNSSVTDEMLQEALVQLSDEQREVIYLHFFEQMSFSEIARVQGCKSGAVRARAHRGYEKLRSILPRDGNSEVAG